MKIEERQVEGVTIFTPHGPLVKADADQLKGYLAGASVHNPERIVIDTSAVPFLDSRGLEVLIEVTTNMTSSQGRLKVAGANETLREVMMLTDTSELFEHFQDVESALRSFK
ncbi:MAG: STAS domain-containing protein [Planctomycetes bacterium]|nr:STAS domain-containing protein [Planctomycetota bacterium]